MEGSSLLVSSDLKQEASTKSTPSTPRGSIEIATELAGIHAVLGSIANDMKHIRMKLAPGPEREIVGARHVADALGCSTQWIGEQVRTGSIPKSCIVPGTGSGKPWKFYKEHIDRWLKSR